MTFLLLWLVACGAEAPCSAARDLADSPGGLQLTAAEHPVGWGQTECFQCHQRWNVHADDCIDGVAVDTDAIQFDTVDDCVVCHGANGVPSWVDTGEAP